MDWQEIVLIYLTVVNFSYSQQKKDSMMIHAALFPNTLFFGSSITGFPSTPVFRFGRPHP